MFLAVLLIVSSATIASAISADETEFLLCHIFRKTSIYQKFNLHQKSSCLSHVKIYGEVACLRDKYNEVLDDTCISTGDLSLFQKGLELISIDLASPSSLLLISPSHSTLSSFNGTVKGFSTTSLPNDKLSQNSPQSTPSSAEVRSFASKSEILSNKGDPTVPSEPGNNTEKLGLSFASLGTGSSRAIVRSEIVVGSGSETVKFSQGLELGSKFNEKLSFPAPVKEKLNDSSDISLQNKKKDKFTLEKQTILSDSPSSCYKGLFNML